MKRWYEGGEMKQKRFGFYNEQQGGMESIGRP